MKKLIFSLFLGFVLFLSVVDLNTSYAQTHCPQTWSACIDVRCWDRTGDPSEGCCIKDYTTSVCSIYDDCLNAYCW